MTSMQNSVVSLSINFIFLNKHDLKDNLFLNFLQWKKKKGTLKRRFYCLLFYVWNLSQISFLLLINKNSESSICLQVCVALSCWIEVLNLKKHPSCHLKSSFLML